MTYESRIMTDKELPFDLRERTRLFGLHVVRMFVALPKTEEATVLGKQVLRSGTSVGANYRETHRARSKPDFIAKLGDCLSIARQMVRRYGAQVLFLDYAQIVRVPGASERREAAEEVSMSFKELARELNVPVVMLAQLKRDADGRRPDMGDFQWTSQFEQDADVACLIWHKYGPEYQIEESFLIMDKVRDGAKAIVPVVFLNQYVTFVNKEKARYEP